MNPCPCGWWGDGRRACRCTPGARRAYRGRVSGPLLDRIDLHVPFRSVPFLELVGGSPAEGSAAVRGRVQAARERQRARGRWNALLEPGRGGWAQIGPEGRRLLGAAHERLGISARGHVRILRVARTIADLDGRDGIEPADLAEAIQYRVLDRAAEPLDPAPGDDSRTCRPTSTSGA